uniref:CSON006193 protein n=1 Tax=Culicoides sonorensis TaxID=179676 RepID=A0A336LYS2_CULSO
MFNITKKVIKDNKTIKQEAKKKKDEFSFWAWFKNRCSHYCSVTALHGYNHLVRKDFALWEKVIWGILSFAAMVVALSLLYLSLHWNSETPTVTVIESTHFATWNIPFPAVTICNANKIDENRLNQRVGQMILPADIDEDDLEYMLKVFLSGSNSPESKDTLGMLAYILKANNLTTYDFMFDIATSCRRMIQKCMWKGVQVRCDAIFQRVMTLNDACCSFNFFGYDKTNYIAKSASQITEARRVSACGFQTGLSVILNPNIDRYTSAAISSYGFRVMIHDAYSVADDNAETKMVQAGQEGYISVIPEATYSTPEVQEKPLEIRKCFKTDEVKLNTMKKYSYINCLAECRQTIVLKACGCIPYKFPNNGSIPVCEPNKMKCVSELKDFYKSAAPETNFTLPGIYQTVNDKSCGCMPDCDYYTYITEISTGVFSRENAFSSESFL